jgi:hypothetical protein
VDLLEGRIELFAASVTDAMTDGAVAPHVVFEHARFVAGTADPDLVALGPNAAMTWIDERNGGSVVNPRPEVRLETWWPAE